MTSFFKLCDTEPEICEHRIKLSCLQRSWVVAALRHSSGGRLSSDRKQSMRFLAHRIEEATRGNPKWILDEKR